MSTNSQIQEFSMRSFLRYLPALAALLVSLSSTTTSFAHGDAEAQRALLIEVGLHETNMMIIYYIPENRYLSLLRKQVDFDQNGKFDAGEEKILAQLVGDRAIRGIRTEFIGESVQTSYLDYRIDSSVKEGLSIAFMFTYRYEGPRRDHLLSVRFKKDESNFWIPTTFNIVTKGPLTLDYLDFGQLLVESHQRKWIATQEAKMRREAKSKTPTPLPYTMTTWVIDYLQPGHQLAWQYKRTERLTRQVEPETAYLFRVSAD